MAYNSEHLKKKLSPLESGLSCNHSRDANHRTHTINRLPETNKLADKKFSQRKEKAGLSADENTYILNLGKGGGAAATTKKQPQFHNSLLPKTERQD